MKGEKTATGAQKETFGTGSAAQSEAGKKGGAISGTVVFVVVSKLVLLTLGEIWIRGDAFSRIPVTASLRLHCILH